MTAQPSEYTKNHEILQFKNVNFMVCESFINKNVYKKKKEKRSQIWAKVAIYSFHWGYIWPQLQTALCVSLSNSYVKTFLAPPLSPWDAIRRWVFGR